MLQRAASNAYSWWWSSHVRTRQSKWLEHNLQDVEQKVHTVLKLLEEDGESFAKRAEMYYKKRPELIKYVEELYRSYRALAERFDSISTELQNANTTIATVFPDRVRFGVDDEDDYGSPRIPKNLIFPTGDLNGKKLQANKSSERANTSKATPKSGLSKSKAVEEIDKLQKEILALQTEKEFVKSSYESGLTKFWEIENRITELQEIVSSLEDEFMVVKVIEDDEARALMAEAALRSCEEALAQLQEKQERYTKEAKAEYQRVEDAGEKLKSLKHKLLPDQQADNEEPNKENESVRAGVKPQSSNTEEPKEVTQERQEMAALREKFIEHFDGDSKESLTVTDMAEKIDELVTKVISLESSVSCQTALIDRLRTETDDLQSEIRTLEDDKATLIDGANTLTNRLREMEENFVGLVDLNQNVKNQNNDLETHFTEARSSLDHLSEKLHTVMSNEEIEYMESLLEEEPSAGTKTPEELEKREDYPSPCASYVNIKEEEKEEEKIVQLQSNYNDSDTILEKREDPKSLDKVTKDSVSQKADKVDDELNWKAMLLNGLEDRDEIMLIEYNTILRNYKDIKKELSDADKKYRESLFEVVAQIRELRSAVAKRDKEIHLLRQKLNILQESSNENNNLRGDNRKISVLLEDRSAKPDSPEELNFEEDIKLIFIDQPPSSSQTEEKLRMNIDAELDKNMNFWLRFCASFHQMQTFQTRFQDLQAEISKLKVKEKSNQGGSATTDIKSDLRPIHKHLREMQTELTLWMENGTLLSNELQSRFSSLCDIQQEITKALSKSGMEGEEEMKFTTHEAAKFQGAVSNMKQETKKVRDELQAGLDHVNALEQDIKKMIVNLDDEFGLAESKNNSQSQLRQSMNKVRVPLQLFIFGTKPKKKLSIFSRKSHDLRDGNPK